MCKINYQIQVDKLSYFHLRTPMDIAKGDSQSSFPACLRSTLLSLQDSVGLVVFNGLGLSSLEEPVSPHVLSHRLVSLLTRNFGSSLLRCKSRASRHLSVPRDFVVVPSPLGYSKTNLLL